MLMACIITNAQDMHFSQIFETPLLRNPSLAGVFTGDVRIQSVFRTQWNTVTVPYQTTAISGEMKIKMKNDVDYITIGGQAMYDKAGSIALTTTELLPAINYNKSLSNEKNMYLSLGFMGGLVQRKFDPSKMTTNNQYDGTLFNGGLSTGETNLMSHSISYLDGSVGMNLYSQLGQKDDNNFYVGLAYHHFNQSRNTSFFQSNSDRVIPKWVASTGIIFSMTNTSYFTLQADYSKQGSYKEIVGGALYSWKLDQNDYEKYILHAGAYMRWNDAIIPVVKLEFSSIGVAASYDANISQLKRSSNGQGGFELSITYKKSKKENSCLDAVRCVKF